MPAQSQQQQKLFGLALAFKRGEVPASEVSDEIKGIADRMSEKEIEDYAKTKHKGLPKMKEQLRSIVREIMREQAISELNEGDGLWANIRAKKARGEKPAHKNSKAYKDAVKAGKKINKDESVTEGYGEFIKAKNLTDIVALSKKKKNAVFYVTDDNNSRIGTFYLKNGKFAKATSANPNYDLQNSKTKLKDRSDVIYKYKVDESVNEGRVEKEVLQKISKFESLLGYITNDDQYKPLVSKVKKEIDKLKKQIKKNESVVNEGKFDRDVKKLYDAKEFDKFIKRYKSKFDKKDYKQLLDYAKSLNNEERDFEREDFDDSFDEQNAEMQLDTSREDLRELILKSLNESVNESSKDDDYADELQKATEKVLRGKNIKGWVFYVDSMSGTFEFYKKGIDLTIYATPMWDGNPKLPFDVIDNEGDEVKMMVKAVGNYLPFKPSYDLKKDISNYISVITKTLSKVEKLYNKIKSESVVNESASKEAMGIAALTGTRGSAVQDFIDTNRINSKKLFKALKSANLQGRINFANGLAGKPGNPNAKLTIKLFGESVNEGTLNESPSSEELRIVMMAVRKIAKYRNVPIDQSINDVLNAAEQLERDIKKGKIKK